MGHRGRLLCDELRGPGVWIRWNGMVEWTGLDWTGLDWNGMEWNDQMICGWDRPLTL